MSSIIVNFSTKNMRFELKYEETNQLFSMLFRCIRWTPKILSVKWWRRVEEKYYNQYIMYYLT